MVVILPMDVKIPTSELFLFIHLGFQYARQIIDNSILDAQFLKGEDGLVEVLATENQKEVWVPGLASKFFLSETMDHFFLKSGTYCTGIHSLISKANRVVCSGSKSSAIF
jgi:hypothetical protein